MPARRIFIALRCCIEVGDEEAENAEQEDADGGAEVGGVGAGEQQADGEERRVLVAGVGDPRGQARLEEQQQAGGGDQRRGRSPRRCRWR